MMKHPDQEPGQEPTLNLGPCCICGENAPIAGIVMLSVKNQAPGRGWGCVICDLPADGAYAVICRSCQPGYERGDVKLQFACRGWPGEDGRVPVGDLTEPHGHDLSIDHDA
jgi:hypothetical protein